MMQIEQRHSVYGGPDNTPKMIVVHAMAEFLPSADGEAREDAKTFLDNIGLSAHVLAAPDGTLIRLRDDSEGAYHAKGFNTDSLGIEVLVPGLHTSGTFLDAIAHPWVTPEQYRALVWQCQVWTALHKIERVARHSDLSPGRKHDPGAGFPWDQFLYDIQWGQTT